jgi:excinuclease ABC subunit B
MQLAYNTEHGIDPQTIRKAVGDILDVLRPADSVASQGKVDRRNRERQKMVEELRSLPQQELARLIQTLEEEMNLAAAELRFEYAARLRDEVKDLRRELRDAR